MSRSLVKSGLHIVVLTATVVVVIWLLPGMNFEVNRLIGYLFIGLVLGLMNDFVRPLLVILTGGLLISTLGLFLIILNFIVFWLLYTVLPGAIVVDDPVLIRLLIASLLISVLSTLLGAVLGLDRPDVSAAGQGRGIWRLLELLPTPRRSAIIENIRLQQVYDTMMSYGLDILVSRTPFRAVRVWVGRKVLREESAIEELSTPAKIRMMLQDLGPTYVKIGQIASAQAGSMPQEWADELAKLQSAVRPFPFEEAKKTIEQELKQPLEKLYATFEREPLAAASTAQVHRATLHDGTPVVVKVQRPQIVAQTKADLGVMESVAQNLDRRIRAVRALDLPGTLREFSNGVLEELDYTFEVYHAQRLADITRSIERIHVVGVYPQYSTSKVLTMDYVSGVKVTSVAALDAAGVDRKGLAEQYTKALVKQVMFEGFFHGDPHPGNLLVNPQTGELTMIDCGMVGELSQSQRIALLDLMGSLLRRDVQALSDAVLSLCRRTRRAELAAYRAGMKRLIYQYVVYAPNADFGPFMGAVMSSLYEYGLKMDSNLSLAIKAILQAQQAANTLDPGADLMRIIVDAAGNQLLESFTAEKVVGAIQSEVGQFGRYLLQHSGELRGSAYKWIDQLLRGGVEVKLDTSGLSHQTRELDQTLRRVTIALVLMGMIMASGIVAIGLSALTLWAVNTSQQIVNVVVPAISLLIYIVVTIGSLLFIWRIAKPKQLEDES